MKIHSVYAHPEATSVTRQLAATTTGHLAKLGHTVQVSDLYAMQWKAAFDAADFLDRVDPERLNYISESGHAYANGTQTADVIEEQRKLLELVGDYDEAISYEDMTAAQKEEIDAMNLSKMLESALAEDEIVDFREVSFILGRLSALEKPELIPIVINNLDRLAPVAHSVAAFFRKFSDMDRATRNKAAAALLDPILKGSKYVSEYYAVWVLSIFADDPVWDHAESLLKILRETRSDVVRRFAALALRASGSRAQRASAGNHSFHRGSRAP